MNNNTAITSIVARELYDSRGVPTIEVDVSVADAEGRCAAPFGAPGSRGEFEASAYGDLGVSGAVAAVNGEVGAALVGLDAADISGVDRALRELDGTANFEHLGGNTSSSISIASAVAAARALRQPLYRFAGGERAATLPIPLGNVIGGGAHALGPTPDMQEHLVLPVSSRTVREAVQLNIAVHEQAGRVLAARDPNFTGGSDDERAWAADLDDTAALEVIEEAAAQVSAQTGASFRLGLDLAADRFWDKADGVYRYQRAALTLTPAQQIDFVESLCDRFNLGYVEDPFESTDFASFAELRRRVGGRCLVVGDDLLATNADRTARAAEANAVNAMIVKVNQIGTVTDARLANDFAQANGIATAISHRSGETASAAIAHLGVAWGVAMIKTGVLGGERLAKLNELIRIEDAGAGAIRLAAPPSPLATE